LRRNVKKIKATFFYSKRKMPPVKKWIVGKESFIS
jgi:hypothetical protein